MARLPRNGSVHGHVKLCEAPVVATLPGAPLERSREERTAERERVVLTVLAAGIDVRRRDVAHEIGVDHAAEPRRVELRGLDAREHRAPTDRDELRQQRRRRFTPERLDMLEARGTGTFLVPATDVGEVD